MEEKVIEKASHCQTGEQGDFRKVGKDISEPNKKHGASSAKEWDETKKIEIDGRPATKDQFDQLMGTKTQLIAITEERNTLRDKNLALAKRCAVLSREMRAIKEESKLVRRQRNILQGRLDDMEDQGIDIGKPRNSLEAEARSARKWRRERLTRMKVPGESDELKIGLGFENKLDIFQGAILETELQNATDEMEDEKLGKVRLYKQKEGFDPLFPGGSDKASAKDSNRWSLMKESTKKSNGKADNQENCPSFGQSSVSRSQINLEMVYGDENSEDLIDWTSGNEDEYQIDFPKVSSGEANHNPDELIPGDDLVSPNSPEMSSALPVNQACEEKLALAQAECDLVKQKTDKALAELEQTRRDLATRTAERNGARQRIQLLNEEIAEREMREVQLKEELRLAREEDPLADKLFVELHELRKKHEELEEERVADEDSIKWLRQEMHNAEVKRGEDLGRVRYLECVVEKNNGLVESLESQIGTANAQLASMSASLNARQMEMQRINTELHTARNNFETARVGSMAYEASLNAAREERNVAQVEAKALAEKLRLANEQRNSVEVDARDLAPEKENAVSAAKPTKATSIDPSLCNLIGDGSQAGDISGLPSSPTLFVNNTPVTPGFFHQPVPAIEPTVRKSTRSTRNPAPTYVDPPSPSMPKQSRKRKPASVGRKGPAKKR